MKPIQNTFLNILTPKVRLSYVKRFLSGETASFLGNELIEKNLLSEKNLNFILHNAAVMLMH
ncbi:MAG: hypothetical protein LBB95_01825 [Mycoplasmataceae bacterium]|jgi:hypothetical protein|nr:hypothetical protein [Mycoplasmataceae bacterium]